MTDTTVQQTVTHQASVALSSIGIILITAIWWPSLYSSFGKVFGAPFWPDTELSGAILGACTAVWPLFIWAVIIQSILSLRNRHRHLHFLGPDTTKEYLLKGLAISAYAGIVEELTYRWLFYLATISTLVFLNWIWGTWLLFLLAAAGAFWLIRTNAKHPLAILTGCTILLGIILLGIGTHWHLIDPINWLYTWILVPLANLFTLGCLEPLLQSPKYTGPDAWAIGAAIVSVSAVFRSAHAYQGLIGVINSWFLSMIFFWVAFTFGLVPAMAVHFGYNCMVFSSAALIRHICRAQIPAPRA